jgi:hypothetical protein
MSKLRSAVEFALIMIALVGVIFFTKPAYPQNIFPGQPIVPLGYCNLSSAQLAASVGLAACVSATFTATGSGTNLTVSAVTGAVRPGQTVTGTGVPTGTTIVSQTSGTPFGAGVYVTSQATTSSGASLSSGGIPIATPTTPGANAALLEADTANIRFRDDGGAPTAAIGVFLVGTATNNVQNQVFYTGTLSAIQFILSTGTPTLHIAFYSFFKT